MTLVAHVREIDASVFPGDACELDQLVRARVDRRRIDQRRRRPDGSVLHRLPDQRLHLLQLLGRRLDVFVAQDHATHLRQSDVVHDIDRNAVALQQLEVLAVRLPLMWGALHIHCGGVGGPGSG